MDSSTWLWLTTAVMTLGGLAILVVGKRRTRSEELHTVLHGIVPIIAACSYFAMAVGQGSIVLPILGAPVGEHTTRLFYFARYIDWTFTTPLLLVTLAMTATHAGPKPAGAISGIVLADLMMVLTAMFFGASEVLWIKWTWFAISCIAFLFVYYVIWVSLLQANAGEREDVRSGYRRDAMILSVLWLIYPVLLLLSPDGLYSISSTAGIASIAILDVVSKVAYGLMTVVSDARVTERDLAETRSRPAAVRLAV